MILPFAILAILCSVLPAAGADPFHGRAFRGVRGEQIRGAALSGDGRSLVTWGKRLLSWTLPEGRKTVLAQGPFGEGGCLAGADIVLEEADGKLVWLEAPSRKRHEMKRHEIDHGIVMHDCLATTLLGDRGVLVVHRYGQVRFYELPGGTYQELYSFYTPSRQAGLLMADVDGDGLPDIFCGNYWIQSPAEFELPWRLFAIDTYNETPDSATLRLALLGDSLVASQGEMRDARLAWFERPADPRKIWTEHRLADDLHFPHALVVIGQDILVGENNGRASRLLLFSKSALLWEKRSAAAHTALAVKGGFITVGPDAIGYWERK